jgi:hypothetical protein
VEICRVDADCASGVCLADGTCAPLPADAAPGTADGPAADAPEQPTADAAPALDADPALCSPNHDFSVSRAEVPIAAGLHATFRVALDATFDTAGTMVAGGTRAWNLNVAFGGDHGVLVETLPLAGQWFESSFAGASYATRLSDESDLLGVFEITGDALLLRGVVSPQGGFDRTELVYDPPAKILSFPIAMGASWTTMSTISGLTSGVASAATEKYESTVDAHGTLETPFGHFDQVLRVNVKLTRTIGIVPTVSRTHAFVSECFGTVATVSSQSGEADAEFNDVAELRRLAP